MLHLIQAEIDKLSIKLKHVNIQNHWLHQEYQWYYIIIYYVDIKSMITDNLTKVLSLNSHCQFLDQMNLINIQDCLQDCWIQEAQQVTIFELLKLMNIDWILWIINLLAAHWAVSQFVQKHNKNQSTSVFSLNLVKSLNFMKNLNLAEILQSILTWIFSIELSSSVRRLILFELILI